jgi:hypothetical protein
VISYNEVAGSYSGIVFGVSNTFASITGIVVPYLISAITYDVRNIYAAVQQNKKFTFVLSNLNHRLRKLNNNGESYFS